MEEQMCPLKQRMYPCLSTAECSSLASEPTMLRAHLLRQLAVLTDSLRQTGFTLGLN